MAAPGNSSDAQRRQSLPAHRRELAPLVLATMASQALLVVLAPTIVAIASELDASVGLVGQARSLTAATAVLASLAIAGRVEQVGLRRTLRIGAVIAIAASAAVAVSPTLPLFLAAHGLVGAALACLVTGGFAGVAAFAAAQRSRAMGYVAGANALAWIVVNPIVGALTEWLSWRVAHGVPALIAFAALLASGATVPVAAEPSRPRLRAVLAEASARRWLVSELVAYGAWTALLTFVGAFFISRLGVGEATTGWLLAAGAAAYFAASTHSAALLVRVPRRRLVSTAALAIAALMAAQFTTDSPVLAAVVFCLTGLAAGIRTPASAGLALEQLPGHPGAMMAARSATTQLGYLLGAVVGGGLIASAGFATLGFVLALGMTASAVLVARVGAGRAGV